MNTIIFEPAGSRLGRKIFCAVLVLGVALFAFMGTIFAAPALTPVSATNIIETSATIIGNVSNSQKNSTVWFEFYNSPGVPTTYATQGIWNGGMFEWHLRDLNPGQTYSYRAGAMEGGVTVYTSTASFTTSAPKAAPVATVSSQVTSFVGTKTSEPKATQVVVVKKEVAAPIETTGGFKRGNTAAIIGAESDLLPHTLIGWVLLLISILIAALIGRMIYESSEKQRKALREKEELAAKAREEETE